LRAQWQYGTMIREVQLPGFALNHFVEYQLHYYGKKTLINKRKEIADMTS